MPRQKIDEDRVTRHIFAAQRSYGKAEDILLRRYRRAKSLKKKNDIQSSLTALAQLYGLAGWSGKAWASFQSLEQQFPKSLYPRLHSAHFLYLQGGDYRGALQKLREIKLSS